MSIRAISAHSTNYLANKNFQSKTKHSSQINFKQQLKDNNADNFINSFYNTKLVRDPKTKTKTLVSTDLNGNVVKEIHLNKKNKAIKMIERPVGMNIKETYYEDDGVTIKEQKEFSAQNPKELVKHLTYNEKNLPLTREYKNGIMIKETEGEQRTDGIITINFDTIRIFDEKTGKILRESNTAAFPSLEHTKEFYYDENNKLIKSTHEQRDDITTYYYNEKEKPIKAINHYFNEGEKKEANTNGCIKHRDSSTKYYYSPEGVLIKKRSKNLNNSLFYSGEKFDPKTGQRKFYAFENYAAIYGPDNKELVTKSENRTTFYNEKTHLPYRVDHKYSDYIASHLYEEDETYFKSRNCANPEKMKSVTYTNLNNYGIKDILPVFNEQTVKSITEDFEDKDSKYRKITIKVNKDAPSQNRRGW